MAIVWQNTTQSINNFSGSISDNFDSSEFSSLLNSSEFWFQTDSEPAL